MLNSIIRFSIRNKLVIGIGIVLWIAWGIFEFTRLPIDALPDITSNQVQVITVSPSLAAPEVERLVTFPVEQANSTLPGIKEMRSISSFGLSVVTIVFKDDIDMYLARQLVSERLVTIRDQIPALAGRPELAPATTGLGEIFQYILRPARGYEEKYDLTELRSIQDWIVRRQLLGTPGVADISSFGGWLKQYEVAVIPDKLKSMNVTVKDVFTALEQNNENSGGAYIEKGPNVLFIRTEGLSETILDIERIFVRHSNTGIPVYIRDVAAVRIGHAVRYGAMTYSDKGEVAGAVVLMLKGANASRVVKDVKARIDNIRKTLPEGVILEAFYDRTKMVNNAISTVKENLMIGALIVLFVLVVFLGNLRAGLIVASVIPLSMLFAVIMMNLFGVSGNLMSLGALDFGLIVDGAVIIVEAVMHRLTGNIIAGGEHRLTQVQMDDEVGSASGKMMNAAVFGQIIILIVYLPILALSGVEGKMFRPMAQTVVFALLGAFLLSVSYVPMMTSWIMNKNLHLKKGMADRLINKLQQAYRPLLAKAIQFPKTVLAIALAMFLAALLLLSTFGGEFIPELEEGDFAVDGRILTGSSLTQSISTSLKAASILKKFPEVEKIVTRIGSSEIPTDPMPVEMTDIIISLKPKEKWLTTKSSEDLADTMSRALAAIPGFTSGFQYPVQMRFNELISGARQDIVCKIYGEDLDTLTAYAHRLAGFVNTVSGVRDIYLETITGMPQVVIRYNREAMARYKLNISDVNQLVRTAFAGESAGLVYENERRYDLVVRLQEDQRRDIQDVQRLLVPTPSGDQLPLSQVAEVTEEEGPARIQRENARRRIIVGFNVRGRDIESVVNELESKTNTGLHLPPGYSIHYGGQFENLAEAKQRLSIAVPLALLLIILMLYLAFNSIPLSLLIFAAVPLSAIGGIILLWLRDMPFSISAGVGFVALFGVAVLNGIVLITAFNRLKQEGMNDVKQITMIGAISRLRPVLITALVASLGFLPMAISTGPGAEVQRPLATVVIGGLISATLLTLFVLPALYVFMKSFPGPGAKRFSQATVILILLMPVQILAQPIAGTKKKLPDMLTQASSQNLELYTTRQGSDYWKQLQTGVFEPGKTLVGVEYGNINSFNNDTRFFISQGFSTPVVYKRRKAYYQSGYASSHALVQMKENELAKEVQLVFYQMVDLEERNKLLQELDSVYGRFAQSAALRLKTGDIALVEQTAAEAQLQQLQQQQQQLLADMSIEQAKLRWLLNTDSLYLPDYITIYPNKTIDAIADTAAIETHPALQYRQQQVALQSAQTAMERSSLQPDIIFGYSNLSIIGYQSTDGINQKYYGSGDRFNVFSFAMGLPIFNKAAKARVNAGKINEAMSQSAYSVTKQAFNTHLLQLREEWKKQYNRVVYYEKTGLQHAALIIRNARLSMDKGQISYIEWISLMNTAVSIKLGYLDAAHQLNRAMIEIEYLTGK